MRFEMYTDTDGDRVIVDAGEDSPAADGQVQVFTRATERIDPTEADTPVTLEALSLEESRGLAAVLSMPPAQARELAAALLRAADEAEHGEAEAASTDGAILAAAFNVLQREAQEGRTGLEPDPAKTLNSLLRAIDRAEGRS
jgi:hypothetical protein